MLIIILIIIILCIIYSPKFDIIQVDGEKWLMLWYNGNHRREYKALFRV